MPTSVPDIIVKAISDTLMIDRSAVEFDTRLDGLDADSLNVVEIIMRLEEDYGIEIPDSACEGWQRVGDIVSYIEKATA